MPLPQKTVPMTAEDYLRNEESSPRRNEFVDGRIFAMSGGTRSHNIIAGNIYSLLRSHVRGSHCRAYMSDVKVRVEAANCFYYPDVMVSCEAYDKNSVFTACPALIVEVLSRSTAAIDRRDKVVAYRQIGSLQEYLIVAQRKQWVELHRRDPNGQWDVTEFGGGASLVLQALPGGSLEISIDAIYEDIEYGRETDWQVREGLADEWTEDGALDW